MISLESSSSQSSEEQHTIMLGYSNLNLPELTIAFAGIQKLRGILDKLEDGRADADKIFPGRYDITPTRRLIVDSFAGRLQPGDAMSVHQTWPESPVHDALRHSSWQYKIINTGAYVIMPETRKSQRTIRHLSHQLGNVPLTVYANQQDSYGKSITWGMNDTAKIATQIEPEIPADQNYTEYLRSLSRQGIRNVIIDNNKLQCAAGNSLNKRLDWRNMLKTLEDTHTPLVGLHVAVGRYDNKHGADRQRSQEDLTNILEGPDAVQETEMGEIIFASYALWRRQQQTLHANTTPRQLPVTMEVPFKSLQVYQERRLKYPDFLQMTRDLGQSLNGFFADLTPPTH